MQGLVDAVALGGEMKPPACQNRTRSTMKCRRACCKNKLKVYQGSMNDTFEISKGMQTSFDAWFIIPCVMCKTKINSITARIVCSDRCDENYWHYLLTGEDRTWFSFKKETNIRP